MSTCVEGIVQELVEKRFNDLVEACVNGYDIGEDGTYYGSGLKDIIARKVQEAVEEEVNKRGDEIKQKAKELIDAQWNLNELDFKTYVSKKDMSRNK